VRARAASDKGDYDGAIAALSELIQGGGATSEDYNNRGVAYHNKRQLDLAVADYARAIGFAVHDWRPHLNRAFIHNMRGQLDQALADLNAAIGDHRSNDANAFILRGRVHTRRGAYDLALSDLNRVVELQPDNAEAYYLRGSAEANRIHALIRECRTSGSGPPRSQIVGGPCSRPLSFATALEDFHTALAKKPNYAEPHFEMGVIAANEGRNEEAVREYSAAIRANPQYSTAYNNRGVVYQHLRKRELALADYEEAIRLDPRNKYAWANRGVLMSNMGHRQRAIADLRKALDIDENYAFAREQLGRLGIRP
jgi:tetratricopeptide (TPR) repeat protein